MNERTRRGGRELFRHLSSAKHLGPAGLGHATERTEDAEIREALNVVLGWSELLVDDVLDHAVRRRAVHAIERNARALRELPLVDHHEAVDAALRVCADLRASGRA